MLVISLCEWNLSVLCWYVIKCMYVSMYVRVYVPNYICINVLVYIYIYIYVCFCGYNQTEIHLIII